MNTLKWKSIVGVISLMALGTSGPVASAQTPATSDVTSPATPEALKVSLTGLDLSTPEGVRAAQERVRRAARRVCAKVANSADIQRQLDYITCIDEAMAPPVAQIEEFSRKATAQRFAHNSATP